eukprot:gene7330-8535_t
MYFELRCVTEQKIKELAPGKLDTLWSHVRQYVALINDTNINQKSIREYFQEIYHHLITEELKLNKSVEEERDKIDSYLTAAISDIDLIWSSQEDTKQIAQRSSLSVFSREEIEQFTLKYHTHAELVAHLQQSPMYMYEVEDASPTKSPVAYKSPGTTSPVRKISIKEIFVIAGEVDSSNTYVYSIHSDVWGLSRPLQSSRKALNNAINTGQFIYVFGGDDNVDTIDRFDTTTHQTCTIGDLKQPVSMAYTFVHIDRIFIIGGRGSDCSFGNEVSMFDLMTLKHEPLFSVKFETKPNTSAISSCCFDGFEFLYILNSNSKLVKLSIIDQTVEYLPPAPFKIQSLGITQLLFCEINNRPRFYYIGGDQFYYYEIESKKWIAISKPRHAVVNSGIVVTEVAIFSKERSHVVAMNAPNNGLGNPWFLNKVQLFKEPMSELRIYSNAQMAPGCSLIWDKLDSQTLKFFYLEASLTNQHYRFDKESFPMLDTLSM